MLIHPQFDPVAIHLGPLAIRWYGLMYLAGFIMFLTSRIWQPRAG
jgi:phosphatidylglycerol:prolipoprotein diacylglycerol transferase